MSRTHDWEIFADESPTEIHHQDCRDTLDSYPTGDATEAAVIDAEEHAKEGETFDRSCSCLDPILGSDRDA